MDPNCIIKCGDLDPNAFGLTAGGQVTLNGMLPGQTPITFTSPDGTVTVTATGTANHTLTAKVNYGCGLGVNSGALEVQNIGVYGATTLIGSDYLVGMFSAVFPDATYDYSAGYHPEFILGTQSDYSFTNTMCKGIYVKIFCAGANINITNTNGATGDLAFSIGLMYSINGGAYTTPSGFGVGADDGAMQNLLKVSGDEISLNSEAFEVYIPIAAGGSATFSTRKYTSMRSGVPATVETTYFTESQPTKLSVAYFTRI